VSRNYVDMHVSFAQGPQQGNCKLIMHATV
jgi:hypothetical protein